MSLLYRQILRMASVKINAVTGSTKTALDSAYLTSPLTTTQIGNTDFTFAMIADLTVAVVGRVVRAYSSVPNHPFRANNISQTDVIVSGDPIPSVDSTGRPIVGVYGAIRNGSTEKVMTEQPLQIIETIADNTDSRLKGTYDYYKIVSDRLYHTTTHGAIIDVCTFSASAELTALNANLSSPLPDAVLDIVTSGLVSALVIDDEYVQQAAGHGQYFENCLAEMRNGAAAFAPAPVLVSSQAPAIS